MNRKPLAWTFWVAALMSALPAAAARPQRRYPLRNVIAVGDRQLNENTGEVSLTLTARSGNQEAPPVESTTRSREKYVEEVLAVQGSTVTRLRQQYLAARIFSTDPAGHQALETSSLAGKTLILQRQAGKVVIRPADMKISAEDRQALSRALDAIRLPFLPEREAALGEAWTVTAHQIQVIFPQARAGTMQARFEEVTPYAGRECAHIRLTGEIELAIEGIPAPVKAQLTGDLYHALGIQHPVALQFAGPLSVDARIEQAGRSLSLTGSGKMTIKSNIQWQRIAGKRVTAPKGKASLMPAAPKNPTTEPRASTKPKTVRYGELTLQLPGQGWKVTGYDREAQRIELGLSGRGEMRGVSLWPVDVPAAERSRSQQEHAAAYFQFERQIERPDGPWTDFNEDGRQIGGQRYPTMSFQFHPHVSAEHVMDGLFLIDFPPDFEQRQRFYVLMWIDLHLKRTPPHRLEELDAVVSSLRVRPLP